MKKLLVEFNNVPDYLWPDLEHIIDMSDGEILREKDMTELTDDINFVIYRIVEDTMSLTQFMQSLIGMTTIEDVASRHPNRKVRLAAANIDTSYFAKEEVKIDDLNDIDDWDDIDWEGTDWTDFDFDQYFNNEPDEPYSEYDDLNDPPEESDDQLDDFDFEEESINDMIGADFIADLANNSEYTYDALEDIFIEHNILSYQDILNKREYIDQVIVNAVLADFGMMGDLDDPETDDNTIFSLNPVVV